MINSVYGEVTGYAPNTLFIRGGSIEWELHVPTSVVDKFGNSSQQEVRIFTYLHHKEDSMQLFGFGSIRERELFLQLLSVSGVGPKLAIKILSGLALGDLLTALDAGDVTRLSSVKGLGAKGAQKIILALRGKLSLEEEVPGASTAAKGSQGAGQFSVPLEGLIQMGFGRKHALDTLKELAEQFPKGDMDSSAYEDLLFREALLRLS